MPSELVYSSHRPTFVPNSDELVLLPYDEEPETDSPPPYATHPLSLTRDLYDPALAKTRPAWREPAHPGYLATPTELCVHWRAMDAHYGTEPGSPLHHDQRCQIHDFS